MLILKASIGLDLTGCPGAFPLPCGRDLGETEVNHSVYRPLLTTVLQALHLITAHELYNELRSLVEEVQASGVRVGKLIS